MSTIPASVQNKIDAEYEECVVKLLRPSSAPLLREIITAKHVARYEEQLQRERDNRNAPAAVRQLFLMFVENDEPPVSLYKGHYVGR